MGLNALVFIVHPSNPIDQLTLAQIRAIYGGEITNWQEVGGGCGHSCLCSRSEFRIAPRIGSFGFRKYPYLGIREGRSVAQRARRQIATDTQADSPS
ncbi:MAG UNVERIFIED_CONTAM: hypothetical protein LVT10_07835 [Anaerolineae bacterium]